jgi:hypothetical protein
LRLCQPLALHCRDALLRILAHELRGRHDVGDGELHRLARTIIKDNRLFDPPDLDGRMPRVSKWERCDSAILGTLALKKRLVLNASCRCLLGTLRGKKCRDINKRLDSF